MDPAAADEAQEQAQFSMNYDFLIRWMEKKVAILGYGSASSDPESQAAIIDFISGAGPKTLCITKTGAAFKFWCYDTGKGEIQQEDLCAYFLRQGVENKVGLSKENIDREVQYGTVGGNGLSLSVFNRIMRGLVEKQVESNCELTGHYHRCMATLTDTVHYVDGRTVL
jgi:hypothetical protein